MCLVRFVYDVPGTYRPARGQDWPRHITLGSRKCSSLFNPCRIHRAIRGGRRFQLQQAPGFAVATISALVWFMLHRSAAQVSSGPFSASVGFVEQLDDVTDSLAVTVETDASLQLQQAAR